MKLSIIITAKNKGDEKLRDLLRTIEDQTFKDLEVLVITEGTSESAKAIGLKKAQGEFVCILASDNYLTDKLFIEKCLNPLLEKKNSFLTGSFPARYSHIFWDDALNRYFALLGGNDPLPWYLGKNDKLSYFEDNTVPYGLPPGEWRLVSFSDRVTTIGDNGFFIRRDVLMKADIENYYHIDVCQDLLELGHSHYAEVDAEIWHRTGGRFIPFFLKRLRYADQHATPQRRWHMVERRDLLFLVFFVISTLTVVYPLWFSFRGYRKVRDAAWFLHLPVCLMTIGVYSLCLLRKQASAFVRWIGRKN